MAFTAGSAGTLFRFNLKINSAKKGFNLKFHLVGANYAAIQPNAIALAGYLKEILPVDSEIFFATISMDNTTKDSRFIRAALGSGHYQTPGTPPVDSVYDMPQTQLLVRLEDTEGQEVPRKIGPIPDEVITDESIQAAITDVVGMPALPLPAIASGADWYANFNLLMRAIVAHTVHVKGGHPPGGDFLFAQWLNAYVLRPCIKKGGRVFA